MIDPQCVYSPYCKDHELVKNGMCKGHYKAWRIWNIQHIILMFFWVVCAALFVAILIQLWALVT